jgi:hypothetical protein
MFRYGARVAAPILIVLQLLIVVKGYKNPLAEAQDILASHEDKVSILTGFSYSQFHDSETYLLIDPDNLNSYSLVITKEKGEMSVIEKLDGIFSYLLGYVFLIALFWWSWFWPKKHNKSMRTTAKASVD